MLYTSPYMLSPPTVTPSATSAMGGLGKATPYISMASGAADLASRFKKSKAPLADQIKQMRKKDPQTYYANESKFKKLARQTPKVAGWKKSIGPALQIAGAAMAFTPAAPVALAAMQAGSTLAAKYADKSVASDLGRQGAGLGKEMQQATSEATGQPQPRQPAGRRARQTGSWLSDAATLASPFVKAPVGQAALRSGGALASSYQNRLNARAGTARPQPLYSSALGAAAPWLDRSIYG